jgi:hypothetical protein
MDSPSPNRISKVFPDAEFGEGDKGGEVDNITRGMAEDKTCTGGI